MYNLSKKTKMMKLEIVIDMFYTSLLPIFKIELKESFKG